MSEHAQEERELRAALQHAVAQVCMEEEMADSSTAAQMSTQAVAALSELTFQYATHCLANDLGSFSRHANRRTITLEDVMLVARKDPQGLQSKLTAFCEREKLSTISRKDNAKPKATTKKKSTKKPDTPTMTQRMKELQERLKKGIDSSCEDSDSSSSNVQMVEKPARAKKSASVVNLNDDSSSDDDDDLVLLLDGKENQKQAATKANKAVDDDDPFASSDEDDVAVAKSDKKAPVASFLPGGTKSGFSSDESDENMFDD